MASAHTSSSAAVKNDKSFGLTVPRKEKNTAKIKKQKTLASPVYTTQAPLEVISFFYHLSQETNLPSPSVERLHLPEDTPLPRPILRLYSSTMGTLDFVATPLTSTSFTPNPSIGEIKQYERLDSVSWNFDEEDEEESPPTSPMLLPNHRSDFISIERCSMDEKIDCSETPYLGAIGIDFKQKPSRERANSLDFAYSEANEASRISVASLNSPKELEVFLRREQVAENKLLRVLSNQLQKSRRKIIVSKPMLNIRENRHERQKDQFLKTYLTQNGLLKGAILRAKTQSASCRHNRARSKSTICPSIPILEELKDEELYLDDYASPV